MKERMAQSPETTLCKNIAAIQIRPAGNGEEHLGLLSQLPKGAELHICGDGFNSRTVKVEWRGHFYFVFMQDIEIQNGREQFWS
jgi:hypothetical protein